MEICELKKDDEKAWDEYVLKHPDSTFYHQIGWKHVVEESYGHKPYYLIAKENGEIKGVLPLFFMKSIFFGRKLVSVPFAPYGGPCADTPEAEFDLINEAKKIMKNKKSNSLEIRNLNKNELTRDFSNNDYLTFIIDLDQGLDEIWKNMHKDKKKGVKKAKNENINIEWNTKSIDDFYIVHRKNMQDLGTPLHSHTFFQNILLEFPEQAAILIVKHENIAICSKFLLFFKDTVISMWGSTLKEYRKFHSYDLANWEAIAASQAKGYKYFDFGRCLKNSGVFEYKMGWSGKQKPLFYQFYQQDSGKISEYSQNNPKRKMFASIWKKLPLSLTEILGPSMRKNFP